MTFHERHSRLMARIQARCDRVKAGLPADKVTRVFEKLLAKLRKQGA